MAFMGQTTPRAAPTAACRAYYTKRQSLMGTAGHVRVLISAGNILCNQSVQSYAVLVDHFVAFV